MVTHRIDFAGLLRLNDDGAVRLRLLGEVGNLALYLGDVDAARELFDAVTLVAPEEPVGHLGLAEAALVVGDARTAERHATRAACCRHVDAPKAAWAHALRARALEASGRSPEAERAAAAVHEAEPDGRAAAAVGLRAEIEEFVRRAVAAGERETRSGP